MKFRKKPVVIEATQWFKDGDHPFVKMWPAEQGAAPFPYIATLEGPMVVASGDWIIAGVKGEHYPCKPDIFEMTYEFASVASRPLEVQKPMTEEQIMDIAESLFGQWDGEHLLLARAVERAHGIGGSDE